MSLSSGEYPLKMLLMALVFRFSSSMLLYLYSEEMTDSKMLIWFSEEFKL